MRLKGSEVSKRTKSTNLSARKDGPKKRGRPRKPAHISFAEKIGRRISMLVIHIETCGGYDQAMKALDDYERLVS